ncbi:hypothetical protein [Nonomuraea sp. PA05]|uniref:hypothetical protein n=1 Tax=Nonomuraea sp. PA05 TaxID=2604466 RepID=UPI0021CCC10D|nr:hypothetical protein [Nonomuraea sp. PA05]
MAGEGCGDLGCFVVDGLGCEEGCRAAAAAGALGASGTGDEEGFGVEAVVRAGESLPMAAQAVVEAAATTAAPAATVVQRRRFEVVLRCELGFEVALRCGLGFEVALRCGLGFEVALRCGLGFEVALRWEPDGSRGSWGDGLRVC